MAINKGGSDITNIQYGNKKVVAVYKGSTKIWPTATNIIYKEVEWFWTNYGSLKCEATTSVSGYSGYYANTGRSLQTQHCYATRHQYQVFNDGHEEFTGNVDYYNKSTGAIVTTKPPSAGVASSTDREREFSTTNAGCQNINTYNGNWACNIVSKLNTGTATQTGVAQRYAVPYSQVLNISTISDGTGTAYSISRTDNAAGCDVNTTYSLYTTECTVGTVNPATSGKGAYNGSVSNLYTGSKVETYNIANSVCSLTNKDVISKWELNGDKNAVTSTDASYCKFIETSTDSACNQASGDYTGYKTRSYKYQNYKNQTATGSVISAPTTVNVSASDCPVWRSTITGFPTSTIGFNGGTYTLKINCSRPWTISGANCTFGITSSSTVNSDVTVTMTVGAQSTSGNDVAARTVSLNVYATNTPQTGNGSIDKSVSQEGCTSSVTYRWISTGVGTCVTTTSAISFPTSTTKLVDATWKPIEATIGSGAVAKSITGLNTGGTAIPEKEQKQTICTASIAGVVYNSGWVDTGDTRTNTTGTSGFCDNRVIRPSDVSSYTCITSGGSNTGEAQKNLNVYRAAAPTESRAYIQLGINPLTVNYIYPDETNCPTLFLIKIINQLGAPCTIRLYNTFYATLLFEQYIFVHDAFEYYGEVGELPFYEIVFISESDIFLNTTMYIYNYLEQRVTDVGIGQGNEYIILYSSDLHLNTFPYYMRLYK